VTWPHTDGLSVQLDGDVLVCTINRPERGNALRHADMVAMAASFDRVSAEREARAVLLGSQGRHFCTGADLTPGSRSEERPPTGHLRQGLAAGAHRLIQSIWDCRVPVVVAIQGRADGLGCHLVAAADFAVASRSARFSEPFTARGFSADSGGTWLLTRRVGLTRAAMLLLRGQSLDGETALAWGLVTELVDDDELETVAINRAAELATGPTLAFSLTNELLKRHAEPGVSLATALKAEAMAVELSVRSDDFKEGMRAFAERRSPMFTGHGTKGASA
jgi:2-(1,2-epoxy-1,2-dihydrophenyl)acetyl-CoA isomerase